jgi:hypothetical protein
MLTATRHNGEEFLAEVTLSSAVGGRSFVTATVRDVSATIAPESERTRTNSAVERVRLEAAAELVTAEGEKDVAELALVVAETALVTAEGEKDVAELALVEAGVIVERLEGELHQSQRMESFGQLAGGVAHDFNNLLAVILNYASFVSEELAGEVATPRGSRWEATLNDVQQIQVAAERASVLTHQLLAFARREVIQARPLNLNGTIRNIEEILRRIIGAQVDLTIDLEPELSMVMADPGHIEQIIMNLAINARDAMPTGGTLLITTASTEIGPIESPKLGAPAGSYVCLRIRDNGVGMSADVRERAFEPFYTTKPRGEGTGLGLSTVYGIVLQSGGLTTIDSHEGVGTTVTVLLPADLEHVETSEDQPSATTSPPTGSETILVVDDEEGVLEVTRRILTRGGYTVIAASSGGDALELAASYEGTIHLLLSDVVMTPMPGATVAREVRKFLPEIRILFMSAHAQSVLEDESLLGMEFQLIDKPFDRRKLLECVRSVIDARREKAERAT